MSKEVDKFNRDLVRFSNKLELNLTVVTRKLAIDLFTSIVRRTPVDTGRARVSWNINAGRPDLDVAPKGRYPENQALAKIGDLGAGTPFSAIYITNNLPYITVLEDGSSTQAPNGMVKVSLQSLVTFLNRALRDL